MRLVLGLGHGERLDVVAAAGEQPDDAREHAGLVVDQHGHGVRLEPLLALLERIGRSGLRHQCLPPASAPPVFCDPFAPPSSIMQSAVAMRRSRPAARASATRMAVKASTVPTTTRAKITIRTTITTSASVALSWPTP